MYPTTLVLLEACEHAIQIASLCISFSCSKQCSKHHSWYAEHPSCGEYCVTKLSLARAGKHTIIYFLRCWPWAGMDKQLKRTRSVHLLHFTHLLNGNQICIGKTGLTHLTATVGYRVSATGLTHSNLCHSWLQSICNWPNPLTSLTQRASANGLTRSHLCHSWLQSICNWPNTLTSLPQLVTSQPVWSSHPFLNWQ